MNEDDMTAEEWCRRPTWHGSYDDYVKHVAGNRAYNAEQQRKQNNEELIQLIATKLRAK